MRFCFKLTALFILAHLFAFSLPAFAANRTFASLTISPSTTNLVAGDSVTTTVALGTKASSGSTASGAVILYVGSISPANPNLTTSISPNSYDIGTSATNYSILTVNTTLATPGNTYTLYVVGATNFSAGGVNGIPITNTFTLTVTSAVANAFSMAFASAPASVTAGLATNLSASVTYLDYSASISGVITNGVTVLPTGTGVSASLNSIYAPITNNFGTTNLTLNLSVAANAIPGTYQLIVSGTNNSFTANTPIPGIASITNFFTIVDQNSFSLSVSPSTMSVFQGATTNLNATVYLSDNSPVLSETITNGVTVFPAGLGVTAGLTNSLVPLTAAGGLGTATLTVRAAPNATPGVYQVIIGATNNDFTANTPVPGIALATNYFTVVLPPAFQNLNLSGTNLLIAGAKGTPYAQYLVLASTNLAIPLTNWTTLLTSNFDGSGNFNASVALPGATRPNAPSQFFTLFQETNLVPAVATPSFSPIAAPYFAAQPVTISSTTAGAIIRYTTDGSTPSETNGAIYTGPVTMQQPVDTNTSGFLSDCSGVTMLKAIAYKSGQPDSSVFTGNYEIIVPAPQTSSSPLCGLADIAYHVIDLPTMRAFYENYLGYTEPFLLPDSNTVAVVKINDQQYIELFQGPLDPSQYQLISYGYQVTNAEVYREFLASNGVAVSSSVTTNFLGNLSFFSTDPDGHVDEWVQYLTNSLTGRTQGQAMPGTQVYGYMFAFGGFTTNQANQDNYLINQCGFDNNKQTDVHLPNNNSFFEILAELSPQDQQNAGKTDKIDLLNFRGVTSAQSIAILTNRNPSIVIDVFTNGSVNSLQNLAGDVYNPDGSRAEIDDCWVQ